MPPTVPLYAVRIPDPTNTQYDFSNPHLDAPMSYQNMLLHPGQQKLLETVGQEIKSMEYVKVWEPCLQTEVLQGHTNFAMELGIYPKIEFSSPKLES